MCAARSPSYASSRPIGSVLNRRALYGRVEHVLDARTLSRRRERALPLGEWDDLGDERLQHDAVLADQLDSSPPRARRRRVAARDRQLAVADLVERDRDRLPREADLDEPRAAPRRLEREGDSRR